MKLDETDQKILSELKNDCHQTYQEIANKTGSNINTVASRIKKLEAQNYILKYLTIINYSKIGFSTSALIKIVLKNPNSLNKGELADIIHNPNTVLAYGMTGNFDLNVVLSSNNFDSLIEEIGQIGKNKNIQKITSELIIKDYKKIEEHNPFEIQKLNIKKKKNFAQLKKPIDQLDKELLRELRSGANKPLRELSAKLMCPISTIKERMDRMENNGVIIGYTASINYPKLGFWGYGLISIKLKCDHTNDPEVIEKISEIPEVGALFRVLGPFDLYAGIIVKSIDQAVDVLKKIYAVSGVQKAESQVALASLKSGTDYNPFLYKK